MVKEYNHAKLDENPSNGSEHNAFTSMVSLEHIFDPTVTLTFDPTIPKPNQFIRWLRGIII